MKKKNLLFASLACTALLLTGCDKVIATLPEGNNPLTDAKIELDHNTLDVIYDSIRNGSNYSSDIKDLLTDKIANEVFGTYEIRPNDAKESGYDIVLLEVDGKSEAEKKTFIDTHKAYWNWDHTGFKLSYEETAPTVAEFEARVDGIKKLIDKQIVAKLWSEANASSYKRNNRFYEVLYARKLNEDLYKINKADGTAYTDQEILDVIYKNPTYDNHYALSGDDFNGFNEVQANKNEFTNGVLVDGRYEVNTDEGIKAIQNILHINFYLDYVNKAVLPQIIRTLLIEQYIIEEQYSAVGNTQSRKVNYIAVADNADKNGKQFWETFTSNYITGTAGASKLDKTTSEKFDIASTAWKGVYDDVLANNDAKELATKIFGAAKSENPSANKDGHKGGGYIENFADDRELNYYEGTNYADLIEQYSTLTNDPNTNNSANYSSFTSINSYNYTPITGLSIKTDDIKVIDYTTSGWETKDTSSLPGDLKTKLYSYGFANEWNTASKTEKSYEGYYIYQESNDNGRYYLRKDAYQSVDDSIIWTDADTYYVVEILDLVTPELVAITSGENGTSDEDKVAIENKVREAAYVLASGSTYTTNALTHYLEQCNIDYHDQDIYDYFVSNFPKLFE